MMVDGSKSKVYKTEGRAKNVAAKRGGDVMPAPNAKGEKVDKVEVEQVASQTTPSQPVVERKFKVGGSCACQCGDKARAGKSWVQGHDQRAFSIMKKALGGDEDLLPRARAIAETEAAQQSPKLSILAADLI